MKRMCAIAFLFSCLLATEAQAETVRCGATVNSISKTGTEGAGIHGSIYSNIRGTATIISVPAGQERCIRVTFSAFLDCYNSSDCGLRAVNGGTQFGDAPFSHYYEDEHATFQWVERVSSGEHLIAIQSRATSDPNLEDDPTFGIDDWVLNVEVTK